jgi:hypothetical protein
VTEDDIASTLVELMEDYELRKQMSKSMADFNLRKGTDRVIKLIFDKYWEKVNNEKKSN